MGARWGRGNAESVKHFRAVLPGGASAPPEAGAPHLNLFNILITVPVRTLLESGSSSHRSTNMTSSEIRQLCIFKKYRQKIL